MAEDAPTGMGVIYGPINPGTEAIGRMAAITAKVARIVGLPTSATDSMETSLSGRPLFSGRRKCRTIFSTTTFASPYENSYAEDKRKQLDPVPRVAEQVKDAERKCEGHRNCQQNDAGFPPAEKDCNQQRDRESGEQKVLQQLIRLRLRGLAAVARGSDVEIAGKRIPFQLCDSSQNMVGNDGRIGALALRNCNGDGGKLGANLRVRIGVQRSPANPEVYIARGFGWAVNDLIGNVAQQNGASMADANDSNPIRKAGQAVVNRPPS